LPIASRTAKFAVTLAPSWKISVTGTLAPGRWADVTIVSVDPFTASPSALLGGRVQTTIVGGRIVHGG